MQLDNVSGHCNGFNHVLVVCNATSNTVNFSNAALQGMRYHLHPVQMASSDTTVRTSTFNGQSGSVTFPR